MITTEHRAAPTGTGAPSARRSRTAVLLLASTLTVMAGATISPALPGLAREFSGAPGSATLVPLLLSAPALAIALCGPFTGALIDRVGRRPVLLAAVALYGLAGGAGLVLGDLWALMASRLVLGVAVAGIMVTATTLVADYFDGEHRAKVLGYQAAFMGLGGTLFLSLGGVLASMNTRGPFAIYLFALVLVPAVWKVIDEPDRDGAATDDGAGGGAAPDRLRDSWRLLAVVYALATVGMLTFYTVPTRMPFLLRDLGGYGPTASGLVVALPTLVGAAVSLLYGRLRARFSFGSLAVATVVLLGAGLVPVGLAANLWQVLAGLVLIGLGSGLLLPTVNSWTSTATPAAVRGAALGGLSTAIYAGQFLSPLLSAPLAGASGTSSVYVVAGALALAAALALALLLFSRRHRDGVERPPGRAGRR